MALLKDEKTVRLDELTSAMDEAIELYRDFAEHVEHAALAEWLRMSANQHRELLGALRECRRAHDDLPQGGDPELAQVRALAIGARSLLGPRSPADPVLEAAAETESEIGERVGDLLGRELPDDEREVLVAIQKAVASQKASLQSVDSG